MLGVLALEQNLGEPTVRRKRQVLLALDGAQPELFLLSRGSASAALLVFRKLGPELFVRRLADATLGEQMAERRGGAVIS